MNPCVPKPAADATFDVAELFVGDDDGLLWLSLGFASPTEPLDVLHIVCGKAATALGLPLHTRFTFNESPALFTQAAAQLAQMAACGQACIAVHEADGDAA
jgi:hypothetical protein